MLKNAERCGRSTLHRTLFGILRLLPPIVLLRHDLVDDPLDVVGVCVVAGAERLVHRTASRLSKNDREHINQGCPRRWKLLAPSEQYQKNSDKLVCSVRVLYLGEEFQRDNFSECHLQKGVCKVDIADAIPDAIITVKNPQSVFL